MNKKYSLKEAFNLYFHDKYNFNDFLTLNVDNEYKSFFISKNTYSPSDKLKDYQDFLNLFIFTFMDINEDIVFSYRKGFSSYDALSPHRYSKYIYTTDINSFFNNIDVESLKNLILENSVKYAISEDDTNSFIECILNISTYKGILPIGSPSSPIISNAYLYKLDNKIQDYCKEKEIIYTRYSDDFIFSSNNIELFKDFERYINFEFKTLGYESFELNINKTKIQRRGNKIQILGLFLLPNGHITVNNKIKKDIEVLLYFYINERNKFKDFFEKKYSSKIERVSGLIAHVSSIDKLYISKLRKKYGSFIVDSFIHRDIKE